MKAGATLVGGALAISGLVWLNRTGPADVAIASDLIRLGSAADTGQAAPADEPSPVEDEPDPALSSEAPLADIIVVRSSSSGKVLAGALIIRAGYLATSGVALRGAEEVLVTWGEMRRTGVVIGHDPITDVSVIHVNGSTPDDSATDARVEKGDEVNMSTEDGGRSTLRVVAAESTSAMANGDPVVGIVELDGRIGDVAPGSPAYDVNGDIVGITTATGEQAPAAIIPIDLAREVADEIIDTGEATHPWLGVTARNPHDDEMVDRAGSLVTAVAPDGPAADGGVLEGDLITTIDDRVVESTASMVATLRSYEPGNVVAVKVWRNGEEVDCSVELASNVGADA